MIKPNIVDNQAAFEYVLYMIFGSYFQKAVLKNKLLEKKLFLQYMEQKEKSQIQMEKICIRFIEKKLMAELPEEIWNQQVEVKIVPTEMKGLREIQFHGPDFSLRVCAIYKGKGNTMIHYEVRKKGCYFAAA